MAAQHDETDGSKDAPYTASNTNGRRSVTNQDLEILSLKITAKIDALATLITGMQTQQTQYATKVETNTVEIEKLRGHMHEVGNKVQLIEMRTASITARDMGELIALLPMIRKNAEIMQRRAVEDAPDPMDLAYIRRARDREEREEEIGRQVTIGQRIQTWGLAFTLVIFIVSEAIHYFVK